MFNLFKKHDQALPPEQLAQFLDGFATGYPLIDQPAYPVHKTRQYRRGLKIGKQAYQDDGCPQVPYEPSEIEE